MTSVRTLRNVITVSDCLAYVASLPDESVNCVISSPPYWQQRAYGVAGEWGSEDTVAAYVANLVTLFREIRRVLRSDGTVWLNLGDKYNTSGGNGAHTGKQVRYGHGGTRLQKNIHLSPCCCCRTASPSP